MPSYSRNSRKPSQALRLGLAAALLIGSAVHAADQPHTFVLTAYSNGAGGASLVNGNYDVAIKALGQHSTAFSLDTSTVSTNRCVAYSVTKQWDAARKACDAAITDAQEDKANLPTWMSWARKRHNDYVALAYSNRAVLHWLSDDSAAAERDLAKAQALAPKADFVARNLDALHTSRNAMAQVAVAPQR
jgi:tetratricopeptide (TPR) repeat protein